MMTVLGLWSWFRGSLIAQIGAGVLAFLAVWKINNLAVARKTVAKVEAKAKSDGRARNAKTAKIRDRIDPDDAWSRLQSEFAKRD